MNDWLSHHGVKGQRWGVRRYQDYNGKRINSNENLIYKKGTSLTRFTNDNSTNVASASYAAKNKRDIWEYKHDAANGQLGLNPEKSVFRKKITTVDDATIRKGRAMVKDFIDSNGDKTIGQYFNTLDSADYFNDTLNTRQRYLIWNKSKEHQEARKKLGAYIHKQIYGDRTGFAEKYKLRGYDAVIDPEDYVWNFQTPLIITNPDKFKVTEVKDISKDIQRMRKKKG